MSRNICLVDFMNSVFISFNQARRLIHEKKIEKGEEPVFSREDIPFFYHVLFKKFNNYFSTYGKIYVCMEGYNSLEWRRSIFPDYKRNRDKSKSEDEYKIIKETFPVIEEIMKLYPTKIIKVNEAEADDAIFVLSEKYKDENVIIISTDNDLSQIINRFDNVKLYNPIKMKYVEKQPHILLEKAIVGDTSDNIPGLNRIGEKTFQKMMEDKKLFNEKMKNGNKEIVETFLKIIDLSRIPQTTKQKILDEDEKILFNEFNSEEIESFYFNNKLKDLLSSWGSTAGSIQLALKEKK